MSDWPPSYQDVLAYYFDEECMTKGELFGFFFLHLNKDPSLLAEIREAVRLRDEGMVVKLDVWLKSFGPDTELYHHHEMYKPTPEFIEAMRAQLV